MDRTDEQIAARISIQLDEPPPGPRSRENLTQLRQYVAHSNYAGLFGITLAQGSGAYIRDIDGNVFLDCLAGASVNICGYGVHAIADAYHKTATQLQHSCLPYSPNTEVVQLAKQLIPLYPREDTSIRKQLALFGVSGSDGVGGALRAMRKFTERFKVFYFKNSYHGSTGLSQQASGFTALKAGLYRPSVDFIALDFPADEQTMARVLSEMERQLKTGQVGGLIAEPIQGDGGVHLPADGFFQQAKQLLHKYGALLMVDEVQTGMGRTGLWWAIEHDGVEPDLLVTAKGLSGGYAPISALMGHSEILSALEPAQQIFTYSGHGPSCAAARATIELIQQQQLVANAARQGKHLLEGLHELQRRYPGVIKQVRGKGLMIGLEVNCSANPWAAKLFATRGVQLGVYYGFFGNRNQVVRIEPPLIISDFEVQEILRVTEQVAHEFGSDTIPEIAYKNTLKYSIGL